jgi:hypothetical protein
MDFILSEIPLTSRSSFFLKKNAKILQRSAMGKATKQWLKITVRSKRANSPASFKHYQLRAGSNNARLLSASQNDAALRNFLTPIESGQAAIFSRPVVRLRFRNNLTVPYFSK